MSGGARRPHQWPRWMSQGGFTLMELMIVVVIISILVAIALPSYQQYILRSRRIEGKNALLDLASRQERYYSINNAYTDSAPNLGYGASAAFPVAAGNYYQLNISAANATSFTATVAPQGAQSADTCGTLQITQTGAKTADASDCW